MLCFSNVKKKPCARLYLLGKKYVNFVQLTQTISIYFKGKDTFYITKLKNWIETRFFKL